MQNSRIKWLKEGDKNTHFFHTIATIRRRCNCIKSLCINGSLIDDPLSLNEAFSYFKGIFKEQLQSRPTFSGLDFKHLNSNQCNYLTSRFSHDEIDDIVKSCDSDKAPWPNDLNLKFIKSSWEINKGDIYNMVTEFWTTSKLSKGSNSTFIALISKSENPEEFKDYFRISIVGCAHKIIVKLLARRLQSVMVLPNLPSSRVVKFSMVLL